MGLTRYSQRKDVGAAGPAVSAAEAHGTARTKITARAERPMLIWIPSLKRGDWGMRDLLRNRFLLIITGSVRGQSKVLTEQKSGT
jgi:hypothetical protein